MTEYVTVNFEASISLTLDDFDGALGDAAQAVQNVIGHTGAVVISAEADHIDEGDEPDEIDADVELTEDIEATRERYPGIYGEWDDADDH